jgi:hypothetical protein
MVVLLEHNLIENLGEYVYMHYIGSVFLKNPDE